ncbi:MAG: hypothetical protein ACWGOY_04675 [Anaerolineales bacterium]
MNNVDLKIIRLLNEIGWMSSAGIAYCMGDIPSGTVNNLVGDLMKIDVWLPDRVRDRNESDWG